MVLIGEEAEKHRYSEKKKKKMKIGADMTLALFILAIMIGELMSQVLKHPLRPTMNI